MGGLGLALNGMLERLEDAFARRAAPRRSCDGFSEHIARVAHAADINPRLRGTAAPGGQTPLPKTLISRSRESNRRRRGWAG